MTNHHHAPQDHEATPAQFWDELYGGRDQVWSGRVNHGLASRAERWPAGRALDLGCGEGADAIWLAKRGWRVVAVDVSGVAIARAREHAEANGVAGSIEFECRDVVAGLPAGPFDLVTAQYFQTPLAQDEGAILRSAAAQLAPGGRLLVVSHAAPPPWAAEGHDEHEFPTPAHMLAQLEPVGGWVVGNASGWRKEDAAGPDIDEAGRPETNEAGGWRIEKPGRPETDKAGGWRIEEAGVVERHATGPDGVAGVLLDAVVLIRRPPRPAD